MTGPVDALFAPESVAIVGASPSSGRGGTILENLLRFGYSGRVVPVNPRHTEVRGLPCRRSLSEAGAYECVVLAVGARNSVESLREAARAGARAAILIASGFAEAGPAGAALQAQLAEIAHAAGMAVCGPNCYGVVDLHSGFAAYSGAIPTRIEPGSVAFLTQSGALTHAVLNPAASRGLRLSHLVTAGNEAVTTVSDYLAHVARDPRTSVVACFVESIRDLAGFIDAAGRAIQAGKRVVVLKTGRSQRARQAAMAHTGAVAGDDRVFDAVCDKLGVIRVDDLDELIECCLLLSTARKLPCGPLAVTSISGGASGLVADLAQRAGLPLAQLSAGTSDRLRAVLPDFANPHNPLDMTGAAAENIGIVRAATDVLATAPEVGALGLALNAGAADNAPERELYLDLLDASAAAAGGSDTPMFAFTMSSGPMSPELVAAADNLRVPLLQGMRATVHCLARLRRAHTRSAARPAPGVSQLLPGDHLDRLARGEVLSERAGRELLARAGITSTEQVLASDPDTAARAAATLGFPVVMKIDSPDVAHKTDIGGVCLDVRTPAQARAAYLTLMARVRAAAPSARVTGVVVQPTAPAGLDVLLGASVLDPSAPSVILGAGGVLTELAGDPAVRIAPLSAAEAGSMLEEFPAAALLDGYRGRPAADRGALVHALVAFSELVYALRDELGEADVNPLRVLAPGQGVLALDALFVPRQPAGQSR